VTLAIKFAKSLLIVVIRGKFWYYDRIERQKSVLSGVEWEISVGILLEEAGRLLALTGAQNMRLGQYD
jgi:hypothetical protein